MFHRVDEEFPFSYHVTCPCGESIEVPASAAGSGVTCGACGRGVPVPRLSVLREMANIGAFETSSIDAIKRLVAEGRLPAGKSCMISGRPTTDWLEVEVECESAYVKKGMPTLLLVLIAPFVTIWGALILCASGRGGSYQGRETRAIVPLRIDREHHAELAKRRSRRKLLTLLRSVPEAARLLDEFRDAKVVSGRGMIDPKSAGGGLDPFLE